MPVPSPREVRRQPARRLEASVFRDRPPDHPRQLADLHVLEAELAREPALRGLVLGRREPVPRGRGEKVRFFERRVDAQPVVEIGDRLARGVLCPRVRRGQEAAEEIVEPAMVAREAFRDGVRHVEDSDTAVRAPLPIPERPPVEKRQNAAMRARRSAASILALGLLTAVCAERGDPIRAALDRIAKAAHERDAAALMNLLTPDFQAGDGSGRADTEALVRRSLAAYEILDVKLRDVRIERAENAARARFRAEFSGRPRRIGGLDGLFPSSASYDFDLRLVRDGSAWKVASAIWNPAGDR